jgi:hypothetical protein
MKANCSSSGKVAPRMPEGFAEFLEQLPDEV